MAFLFADVHKLAHHLYGDHSGLVEDDAGASFHSRFTGGGVVVKDLLERLRVLLSNTPVQNKLGLKVTASFGAAMRPAGSAADWDEMFSLADQRLYLA